jgi:hypothetical protein
LPRLHRHQAPLVEGAGPLRLPLRRRPRHCLFGAGRNRTAPGHLLSFMNI